MSERALRIVLIVSLVLNVFVIGGLVGAAVMWKRVEAQRPLVGIGRPARLREAAQALSPPNRRMLRQTVRAAAQSLRPQAEQARAARREAGRLLVQPKFDRAAFEAALARARTADVTIRTRLETAVVDAAAKLPVEERVALADAMDRSGAMRRPREPRQGCDQR
ncbi:periplasmic heavy metal sensor [Sphingobium sp. AS12]|uniref:periplasmic heavy metal sensor n=1 Tax=Sphingobium sp. AS12 TaxID=2849495 RepID=UPI001C31A82E|nr:periplasmic heavy metal sensor [Sphingobium sp. AS12]MBV2149870.1 periplasmic heavy metal sensor [Sphingobium sp. AS12]